MFYYVHVQHDSMKLPRVKCSYFIRDLLGVTTGNINTPLVFFINTMISPEQFHMVYKNSISASMEMNQSF